MNNTIDNTKYLHLVGRLVQDKHDFRNQARITGFRKKGEKKKLYLQLQLKGRRRWYRADTVLTHWDLV